MKKLLFLTLIILSSSNSFATSVTDADTYKLLTGEISQSQYDSIHKSAETKAKEDAEKAAIVKKQEETHPNQFIPVDDAGNTQIKLPCDDAIEIQPSPGADPTGSTGN
jgi:hypothetical protein